MSWVQILQGSYLDPGLEMEVYYSLGVCYQVNENLTNARRSLEQASSSCHKYGHLRKCGDIDTKLGKLLR